MECSFRQQRGLQQDFVLFLLPPLLYVRDEQQRRRSLLLSRIVLVVVDARAGTQFNRKTLGLNFDLKKGLRFHYDFETYLKGSRHVMEWKVLFSMEVKVAIPWSHNVLNSREFHDITGLTFTKCTPVDSMEWLHAFEGLTYMACKGV